ncbi:MAG: phytanoyl-CoA dioxygenase family protein [Bacteroidota bacterium]
MTEVLTAQQIQQFITDGYVRIDHAFDAALARAARAILWKDTGCDPNDKNTWTRPVIRLGMYTQEPFIQAANTPKLHAAFNQLGGENSWLPCKSMGTFPVRFPSTQDPGDTGWHVDVSFPGNDPSDYFEWRANIHSRGRALLMLFLFSDVGEHDAPTRIRPGSHRHIARLLKDKGEQGLSFMELAGITEQLPPSGEVYATGKAGTVYLCHPFIVHSGQPHTGTEPRFMAQPPLLLRNRLQPGSPVEQAIQQALLLP